MKRFLRTVLAITALTALICCIPQDPVTPGPDDPDAPETPIGPDNPDTPDNPENPENPENPDNPENPGNPDATVSLKSLSIAIVEGLDPENGIYLGNSFHLKVSRTPENTTEREVTWQDVYAGYTKLTTVSEDEILVEPIKEGEQKIYAISKSNNSIRASIEFKIHKNQVDVKQIVLTPSEIVIPYEIMSETFDIEATVLPEEATNKNLTWVSDNPDAIKVNARKNGGAYVRATKSGCSATITATSVSNPAVHASCIVTVKEQTTTEPDKIGVESITIESTYMQRAPGSPFYLKAAAHPDNANYYDFEWQFEDGYLTVTSSRYDVDLISLSAIPLKMGTIPVTIIDKISGASATCELNITYKQPLNAYRWVDLGLSVLWAECNCYSGPSGIKPSNWSNFAWGETETKSNYTISTYAYSAPGQAANENGVLKLDNDACRQVMKAEWRTPSDDEYQELFDSCTWTETTYGDVNGMLGTSRVNGETIFFPYTGYQNGTINDIAYGNRGYYWTRNIDINYQNYVKCALIYKKYNGTIVTDVDIQYGYFGMAVRGVLPKVWEY